MQRMGERGDLTRVRSGWYALPEVDPLIVAAARAGGAAGCVSGLAVRGLWVPPGDALHIAVPRNARRIRATPGTIVHWTGLPGSAHPLATLEECVRVAVRCSEPAAAFAIVESVLRSRRNASWMPRLLSASPPDRRDLLLQAGTVSESGTESIVAFHLTRLGIPFRPQVGIPGVGRVDFVLGDRLVIEADSEEHHGKLKQRRRDLKRDVLATALGFTTIRLDYMQVMYDWTTAELAIRSALARGDHVGRRLQMS